MNIVEPLKAELPMEPSDHPAGESHVVVPGLQRPGAAAQRGLPGNIGRRDRHGIARRLHAPRKYLQAWFHEQIVNIVQMERRIIHRVSLVGKQLARAGELARGRFPKVSTSLTADLRRD
jgi:hypothetical protein